MRVHRLRITAFGPFATRVEIDLDALAASGLFLLHGPTGAGKTSILDAVCFALYGCVPGSRQGARLRSDHATDSVAPEVVCEFTAGGRRLEVTRSPAWERPKKRGAGTTLEQARVLVRELIDGEWTAVTSRIDEAGDVLDGVLGLGAEQFTKLVLLPQGEFAAFLRANAEERRALLERLFGTDRFAGVQQWLREAQATRRQEVEAADARTAHLLARAEQAAGMAGVLVASRLPGEPAPGGAEADSDELGDPQRRVHALRAAVEVALEEARRERVAAQERAQHAALENRAAVETARLQARHAELRSRAEQLGAQAPDHVRRTARLAAGRRATGIARWLAPLDAARARSARALTAVDTAMVDLVRHGTPQDVELDDETLQARAQGARELVGELAAIEQDAADATAVEQAVARAREAAEAADRVHGERSRALREQTAAREHLAAEITRSREAAAGVDAARAAMEQARVVAAASRQVRALTGEATALADRRAGLRQRRDDARGHLLDLRERRLAGMAAELARGLEPGGPCPVCGSADHPAPAPATPRGPDDAAERRAEAALSAAQDALADCEAELARVEALAGAAAETAGGVTVDAARAAAAAAEEALRNAEVCAARLDRLHALLHEHDRAGEGVQAALEQASERSQTERMALVRLEERWTALRQRVEAARGDHPTVAARRAHAARRAAAGEALLEARREVRAATQHLAEVTDAARAAAIDAGFGDLDEACGVVLDPEEITRLERAGQAYEQEQAVVEAGLADPAVAAAGRAPVVRPAVLAAAEELARADDEAATATLDRCRTAAAALTCLDAELQAHLGASAPLRRRHRLWSELSRCVDGTGGDNILRMSLSSYVLAARLEQVAAAASERLLAMSGGRYSLEHSEEAERGRGRSGLSLRVLDGWTGRRRDTASLSGGESFYTSLALALGLADVVTAEAGGARVETLFVDEGFGSLDEETLQEVMDTLDGLRSGGRVVGLVSHVPDLRDRIPARLEVVKTRSGSTVRQATA